MFSRTFLAALALLGGLLTTLVARGDTEAKAANPFAPPPVESLKESLSGSAEQRFDVLTRVTPRGFSAAERKQMIELLIPVLDDEYPSIRSLAAESLALFGAEAKPALPKLIERMGDRADSRTPTTVRSFEGVWVAMSRAAAAIGPEAIDPLLMALPESDQVEFYAISAAFSEMGEAAKRVAPHYIELLRSGPATRTWAATYTLSKLGDASLPALPELIANLDSKDFNLQVISCRALAELGSAAQPAVPKLLEVMEKGILSSRTHAAMCLGAIGPVNGVDLVTPFSQMAQEQNAFCQERGMIALGRLGHHAREAAPLVDRLIDEDRFSQKPEAARTLWQLTGETERTLQVLRQLMDDPTYDYRVYAVLEEMGPAAAPLAARIANKLDTEDQSLRLQLVQVLTAMGPAAADQRPALQARLEDSSREVVLAIDKALAAIGGLSRQSLGPAILAVRLCRW